MTEKTYDYQVNTGVSIICNSMLPANTIYCSEDIFEALQQSCKTTSMIDKLQLLFQQQKNGV